MIVLHMASELTLWDRLRTYGIQKRFTVQDILLLVSESQLRWPRHLLLSSGIYLARFNSEAIKRQTVNMPWVMHIFCSLETWVGPRTSQKRLKDMTLEKDMSMCSYCPLAAAPTSKTQMSSRKWKVWLFSRFNYCMKNASGVCILSQKAEYGALNTLTGIWGHWLAEIIMKFLKTYGHHTAKKNKMHQISFMVSLSHNKSEKMDYTPSHTPF